MLLLSLLLNQNEKYESKDQTSEVSSSITIESKSLKLDKLLTSEFI
jgi:hypothetical protein